MDTAAELDARAKLYHPHLVAVFLSKECDGTQLLGLFDRNVAMLVEMDVLAYHVVHQSFCGSDFFIGHLLEVGEVEAQGVVRHE